VSAIRALFIGGSGVISSACSRLAVETGIELTVLNRGESRDRPLPSDVKVIRGDVRDRESLDAVAADGYDVVVDWLGYSPDQVRDTVDRFRGRVGQYVFISSASAYQTPPLRLPIVESTPLRNPFWQYSRDKIRCEELLTAAYRDDGFPATIVRPSHTYDRTSVPLPGYWTAIDRMRRGKDVIVHGDGTSLWTLTHHDDFARGFVPLLGHPLTIGEAFHITSDESLTWNQIALTLASAAGVEARIVHVTSDAIAAVDPEWGGGLLGDKAHSMVFDNSKLRQVVPGYRATIPFHLGAREIVAWYDEDPARQQVDAALNATMDRLIAATVTSDPLSAQQAYYRAAAPEYDESYGADGGPLNAADRALDFVDVSGDVVELASGTGQWSRRLEPRVDRLTCVDGADETIAIARTRVGSDVDFIKADIFSWQPPRRFDAVFFAFWLSHVPWDLWPEFWRSVARMIGPEGVVGVVDETADGVLDKERWTEVPDLVTRALSDGSEHRVVKLRLDPDRVVAVLADLGWTATVDLFYPGMFALRASLTS
jgi:nucleoside-diphosphate-sugar epimerase